MSGGVRGSRTRRRDERGWSEQGGTEGPAGLSWPWGEVGYLYTRHLNMIEGGGWGAALNLSLCLLYILSLCLSSSNFVRCVCVCVSLYLSLSVSFSPALTLIVTSKQEIQDQTRMYNRRLESNPTNSCKPPLIFHIFKQTSCLHFYRFMVRKRKSTINAHSIFRTVPMHFHY